LIAIQKTELLNLRTLVPTNLGCSNLLGGDVATAMHALDSALRTAKRLQYNKTAAARIRAAAEFVSRKR